MSPEPDDCDGLFDEDDPDIDSLTLTAWGRDTDGDGFGTNVDALLAYQAPVGFGVADTDCEDANPDINPSMPEICNPEGPLDDDCDGLVDDADPDISADSYLEWYADRDGDGFGAEDDVEYACIRPEGTAATNDDCDDADPAVGPPSLWYADGDGDGFGDGAPVSPTPTCAPPFDGLSPDWVGFDCDPADPAVYPGAEEVCEDGVDQDCDGLDRDCFERLENELPWTDGYVYASINDAPVDADYGTWINTCQTDPYPVPFGWEVVPLGIPDIADITFAGRWGTHCMLIEDGCTFGTSTFSYGDCYAPCGLMGTDGTNYWATSCSRRVMIRRPL